MHRRDALKTLAAVVAPSRVVVAAPAVSTLTGTGVAGSGDGQVNNPYGLAIGPDRALYFCDLDNQRIRRFDLTYAPHLHGRRQRRSAATTATAARRPPPPSTCRTRSTSMRPATSTSPNATATSCARSRRRPAVISTVAGTGVAGFAGDGGPAAAAQLRQPHSIVVDAARGWLLICDIGNHRVRRVAAGHRHDRHVCRNRRPGAHAGRRAAGRHAAERSADAGDRRGAAISTWPCARATPSTHRRRAAHVPPRGR